MPKQRILRGGGAGRWKGKGDVYVMKARQRFKIGHSVDIKRRVKEIRREPGRRRTKLLDHFPARERSGAESKAQRAVRRLGMMKDPVAGNATDWFINPFNVSDRQVLRTVKKAVKKHNNEPYKTKRAYNSEKAKRQLFSHAFPYLY